MKQVLLNCGNRVTLPRDPIFDVLSHDRVVAVIPHTCAAHPGTWDASKMSECRIFDLSDKGRRAGKHLRYEVLYYCTVAASDGNEIPALVAKFRAYGDAVRFAHLLASTPDATEVIIRS